MMFLEQKKKFLYKTYLSFSNIGQSARVGMRIFFDSAFFLTAIVNKVRLKTLAHYHSIEKRKNIGDRAFLLSRHRYRVSENAEHLKLHCTKNEVFH